MTLTVPAQQEPVPAGDPATTTFKTTVRRVVEDVVVTDADGNAVRDLKAADFILAEDGERQKVLSFEADGFDPGMDYEPPKLPVEPANTFVNLPATPEKGPLYVLLLDLVNMDNEDQMSLTVNQHEDQNRGRQQLIKFIQNKPEGARFAIFVWSDGPHLIQGFTSDKAQLFAAVDPHSSRPHIPQTYLMGENVGRGDPYSTLGTLRYISNYLDGLPGRKNLIWFSGGFPMVFFAGKDDGPTYTQTLKSTLNGLAREQVAIYPVDVRGVVAQDWHTMNGMDQDGPIVSQRNEGSGAGGGPTSGDPRASASAQSAATGRGQSLLSGSYNSMNEIARQTGGRAFYSNNDASASLLKATDNGTRYYSMTYAPSDRNYDGKLRTIHLELTPELSRKGYRLAYRHTYYGTDDDAPTMPAIAHAETTDTTAPDTTGPQRRHDDTLDVNMKHGAPTMHQLVFVAQVHAVGTAMKGTPEQMAHLAKQSGSRKKDAKTPAPIPLQKFEIDLTVTTHQLQLQATPAPINLELAVAAYDADGTMLNADVSDAKQGAPAAGGAQMPKAYRFKQQIDAPVATTSLRFAVFDANTGRVGAMEIKLPLAAENQSAATTDAGKKAPSAN